MYKILSIDGGGIRGIIPATILHEIETRTGQPIASMFNMIAGTSTGGILACALTYPEDGGTSPRFSAGQLIDLYAERGTEIFDSNMYKKVVSFLGLVEEKFGEGLFNVMDDFFGSKTIDASLVDTLITAYDIERRSTHFFKSRQAAEQPEKRLKIRDVAVSTASAPTYFEPHLIEDLGQRLALVDGGVVANNPAMCAVTDALSTGVPLNEIAVLSIGTGQVSKPYAYEDVKDWGIASWVQPLIDVIMDGCSDAADYQVRQLLRPTEDGTERYHRLQIRLSAEYAAMDDASETNTRNLRNLAESYIKENDGTIEQICELITGA